MITLRTHDDRMAALEQAHDNARSSSEQMYIIELADKLDRLDKEKSEEKK